MSCIGKFGWLSYEYSSTNSDTRHHSKLLHKQKYSMNLNSLGILHGTIVAIPVLQYATTELPIKTSGIIWEE